MEYPLASLINLSNSISILSSNAAVFFICLGIFASFIFLRWQANFGVKRLERDLQVLRKRLVTSGDSDRTAADPTKFLQTLVDAKELPKDIKEELKRIKDRIILIGTDYGQMPFTLDNIRQEFRSRQIIGNRINIRKLEAYPGIFTGVGLLFTFIFLALALYGLGNLKGPQALETVNQVLAAASAKFATSIIGLICGMWMTLFSKNALNRCDMAVEKVVHALSEKISDRGAEESVQLQLQLLTEMLTESREQVGQLKRFETDFAVSIAGAIEKVMGTRFESFVSANHTNNERLVHALAGVKDATERNGHEMAEKIGGINEQAMQKMVSDLQSLVRDTMATEMAEMKAGLASLAYDLTSSGEMVKSAIVDAGHGLSEKIEASSSVMKEDIEAATKNSAQFFTSANETMINTLAQFNEVVNSSIKELLAQLDSVGSSTRESLSAIGERLRESSEKLSELVENSVSENAQVSKNLQDAANNVKEVFANISHDFKETGSTIGAVIKGFQGTGESLDQTAAMLNINTEKFALAASSLDHVSKQMQSAALEISQGSQSVEKATTVAMQEFGNMSKLLARTNTELGITLESTNTGLSTYAVKVRDLHQSIDQEMAKAISGLEATVGEFTETLEELLVKLEKVETGA